MPANLLNIHLEPTPTWVEDFLSQHKNPVINVRGAVMEIHLDDHIRKGRILMGLSKMSLSLDNTSEVLSLPFINYQYTTQDNLYINYIPDPKNTVLILSFQYINQVVKDVSSSTSSFKEGYSIAINTSNFGHKFFVPANAIVRVFTVTVPREWLQNLIDTDTDAFIQQLLASPDPVFIYEIMPFSIQQAFEEILQNELNTFIDKMTFQEQLSRMIRLLFVQMGQSRQSPTKHKLKSPDIEALIRTEKLLLANLKQAPTIRELASEAAMSETKYKTAFKQLYGRSVYDYYVHYCMETARRWLTENRLSVTAVAQELGYSNISYFSRAFKKHFGQYPSKYE